MEVDGSMHHFSKPKIVSPSSELGKCTSYSKKCSASKNNISSKIELFGYALNLNVHFMALRQNRYLKLTRTRLYPIIFTKMKLSISVMIR